MMGFQAFVRLLFMGDANVDSQRPQKTNDYLSNGMPGE
jgi:hypothetical protein